MVNTWHHSCVVPVDPTSARVLGNLRALATEDRKVKMTRCHTPDTFTMNQCEFLCEFECILEAAKDTEDLSRGVESAMIYAGARAKGDEMADAAKEDGESVEGQVAAAAEGAMDSMNDENAKISDVVSAAYKSAKETGLEEGMTEPAAQTAAVEVIKDELEKSGMSSAEAHVVVKC